MKSRTFCIFIFLLFLSCGKKIEKQFPVDHYILHIENAYFYHEGYKYEPADRDITVRMLSSNNSELEMRQFSVTGTFDTSYAATTYLAIDESNNVSGILNTGWGPFTVSNGEIFQRSKKEYIIEGDIFHVFLFDSGPSSDWVDIYGKFTFERML